MSDQSKALANVLDSGVRVLAYHGMMDMLLPVGGMAATLNNLDWSGREEWRAASSKKPYWFEQQAGATMSELMGYFQSSGNLTFVTIRNSGHMVPIDQPKWSSKIVKDFVTKDDLNLGKGELI